jgi:MFS family permease
MIDAYLSISKTFGHFMISRQRLPMILTLIVVTLGYFVDVYDIWIFAAVRVPSLKDIGVADDQLLDTGILLLNLQMGGMLLGGMFFGIAGDKFGRTRVMFLSILTYSLATIANAFVQDVTPYCFLRFLSGFGLAGELGLGATLVAESLSRERRGLGVGIMVALGVVGAFAAGLFAQIFDWRTCYLIGGGMGLVLLAFRMRLMESNLFTAVAETGGVVRGNIFLLFQTPERAMRFFWCLMLGLPTWFIYGILVTFSQELTTALNVTILATPVLMVFCNIALPIGDISSVLFSQLFKNRRKVFACFIFFTIASMLALFYLPRPLGRTEVIILYFMMSFGIGSWVLMTLISAEVFGTNLRATVATSVPNFARASVIPLTLTLTALKGHMPLTDAVLILSVVSFTLPLLALWRLPETFGRSMEFIEKDGNEKSEASGQL